MRFLTENERQDHHNYLEWRRIAAEEGELAAMEYRAIHSEQIARAINVLARMRKATKRK